MIDNVYFPQKVDDYKVACLGIGAHQDDLEVMAGHGIISGNFAGVIVTSGSGSSRSGKFKDYSDSEMADLRKDEQKTAAKMGGYKFIAQLGYSSSDIKKGINKSLNKNLKEIILASKPEVIYTHNPFDKHMTHVAVTMTVINVLKDISYYPKLYGCEVWRGLDWLDEKLALDVSGKEQLLSDLINVFSSQVEGGKRYDLATIGRMRSNATFFESHFTDKFESIIFAVDMSELLTKGITVSDYIKKHVDKFQKSLLKNVKPFSDGI